MEKQLLDFEYASPAHALSLVLQEEIDALAQNEDIGKEGLDALKLAKDKIGGFLKDDPRITTDRLTSCIFSSFDDGFKERMQRLMLAKQEELRRLADRKRNETKEIIAAA